jgi:hypothetical protein
LAYFFVGDRFVVLFSLYKYLLSLSCCVKNEEVPHFIELNKTTFCWKKMCQLFLFFSDSIMGEEDLSIAEILYQNFVTDGPETGKETRSELGALGVLEGEEHILSIVPDPDSN